MSSLIFCENDFEGLRIYPGFQLDLALMPLGKLSRDVIKKGFELLQKLENHIIEHGETIDQEITRYTNEFFANIPHNVGNNGLPSLNRINLIEVSVLKDVDKMFRSTS